MAKKKDTEDHSLFPNALKEADVKDKSKPAEMVDEVSAHKESSEPKIDVEFSDYIVVVDDSAPNLIIVSGILKKFGIGSLQFKDGVLALDYLKKAQKEELAKIKAVFSDYLMPNLDGLGLLREVRKDEILKHLPFLILTSNADKKLILEARALAINGFIIKPITTVMIAEKISALFPGRIAFTNPIKASGT
jgi:two-component system chemotaxis response regulator CheY